MEVSQKNYPFGQDDAEHFMDLAIQIAEEGLRIGEVPVGCLLVHIPTKQILGYSFNQTSITRNATRHCEVECLSQLQEYVTKFVDTPTTSELKAWSQFTAPTEVTKLDNSSVYSIIHPYSTKISPNTSSEDAIEQITLSICSDCTIIVTVEPCIMCAPTLALAGIPLVFAGKEALDLHIKRDCNAFNSTQRIILIYVLTPPCSLHRLWQ